MQLYYFVDESASSFTDFILKVYNSEVKSLIRSGHPCKEDAENNSLPYIEGVKWTWATVKLKFKLALDDDDKKWKLMRETEMMGFEIDVMPEGNMLLIENVDVPGVIGKVGRILGDSQINIAEFLLSRTSKGNNAFSIVKVDDRISTSLMQSLERLDEIMKVIQLEI